MRGVVLLPGGVDRRGCGLDVRLHHPQHLQLRKRRHQFCRALLPAALSTSAALFLAVGDLFLQGLAEFVEQGDGLLLGSLRDRVGLLPAQPLGRLVHPVGDNLQHEGEDLDAALLEFLDDVAGLAEQLFLLVGREDELLAVASGQNLGQALHLQVGSRFVDLDLAVLDAGQLLLDLLQLLLGQLILGFLDILVQFTPGLVELLERFLLLLLGRPALGLRQPALGLAHALLGVLGGLGGLLGAGLLHLLRQLPGLLSSLALLGGLLLGLGSVGLAALEVLVLLEMAFFLLADFRQAFLQLFELGDLALEFHLAAVLQLVDQFLDVLLGRLLVGSGGGGLVAGDLPGGAAHLAGRIAVGGVTGCIFQGLGDRRVALLELPGRFADLFNSLLQVARQFTLPRGG